VKNLNANGLDGIHVPVVQVAQSSAPQFLVERSVADYSTLKKGEYTCTHKMKRLEVCLQNTHKTQLGLHIQY
jgi:hypothetical protein